MMPQTFLRSSLSVAALGLFAACSGGGGGPAQAGPNPAPSPKPPANLTESLNMLGINTDQTARLALNSETLSENYTPIGTRWSPERPSEVVLAGLRHTGANGPDVAWLEDGSALSPGQSLPRLATAEDAPWVNEEVSSIHGYASRRAFAGADIDADGRDELAAVYFDSQALNLVLWEDTFLVGNPLEAPTRTETTLANLVGVRQVAIAAADFDGDTFDELLVGYTTADGAVLAVYDREGQGPFTKVADSERTLTPATSSNELSLVLACGNLDQDPGCEYAYVFNEFLDEFHGEASYGVIDDKDAGWELLRGGAITANALEAQVASVAIGDIDGDTLDEIVFGGLYGFGAACDPTRYLGLALDDKVHEFGVVGEMTRATVWQECNSIGYICEFAHVALLDIDKDRRAEVVLNQHVFELDNTLAGIPWREKVDANGEAIRLPEDAFFANSTTPAWTRATSSIVTGDVTADGYDDILLFRQGIDEVKVFSPQLEANGKITLQTKPSLPTGVGVTAGFGCNPVIVSMDTDNDATSLVRTEAEHELVFSQPIVLAVLASPPTVANVPQNYEECRTTFGNTQSTSSESERSLSVKSSVSVGISVSNELTQSAFELKNTVTVAATFASGDTYALSETVEYTSGSLEDTVVFACLPLDRYVYRIVRSPESGMVNEEVVIDLPRRPIVLQVERSYYNARVIGNAPIIDDNVLRHTIGDVSTYPTIAQRNVLLGNYAGAATNPVSVGQGVGFTAVTLSIAEAESMAQAYEAGYEVSIEVTGLGVLAGFSVGGAAGTSMRTTIGQETTYSGSVGSIDGPAFESNFYQFGLFTYYYLDPASGQRFQVLNYWVQ